MDGMLRDIRFGVRNLARNPGLTAVVILSLALGIGANTAIFSLIRVVMLQTLPVRDPGSLVLVHWCGDSWPTGMSQSGRGGPSDSGCAATSRSMAYPFYRELVADTANFAGVLAFAPLGSERQNTTLAFEDGAERVDGEMVSGTYFGTLGITPVLGRLITTADENDAAHVAVISHGYWTRRFAGDTGILNASVTVNGVAFSVIGVAAPGFTGLEPGRSPDVWVPMLDDATLVPWGYRPAGTQLDARRYWWTHVMARTAAGVDPATARTSADAVFQRFVLDALPEVDRAKMPRIGFESGNAGLDTLRSSYGQPLQLLMGMVVLVLLIACANVAVLLLTRAMSRRRELAVRLSLGAARARLIRQLLTESMLMAALGGLLGVITGAWTMRGLLLLIPGENRPLIDGSMDPLTLAFVAAVSMLSVLIFGLAPALLATRGDLLPSIKQAAGSIAAEPRAHRTWSAAFVIAQISLSVVLLAISALFVRTLINLQRQPLGVDDQRILVFGVDASQNGYDGARLQGLYTELLQRLQALPGAERVSASRLRLFSGWVSSGTIAVPGVEPKQSRGLNVNAVAADFAATTGMKVLAGRDITAEDVQAKRRVAVINEQAARHFFGDTNVLGRRFSRTDSYDEAASFEIIGVVSNARYSQVRGTVFPRTAYIPFASNEAPVRGLYFHIRTPGDPLALAGAARAIVRDVDPQVAMFEVGSMSSQVADSIWQDRLLARLTTSFSALALVLACVGLYGTISYGVTRRRSEIAVRMALGARRAHVQWLVLRRALALLLGGLTVGIPLALWAGTFVASQLFGLTSRDPLTLTTICLLLMAVVSFAGGIPARRASLLEPALALKQE
jgi:macrolide transport system ATP-binding/permease protein